MIWIKICGLKSKAAVQACLEAGANAVGFVLAESSRRITPEEARMLGKLLPEGIEKVGVFVNEPAEQVLEVQRRLHLDVLQFHGEESPAYCAFFRKNQSCRLIKAFSVGAACDLAQLEDYRHHVDAYLLDTREAGRPGGTGKTWDWHLGESKKLPAFLSSSQIILAGGLTPENVNKALELLRPGGVDVSSGVESGRQKDPVKIKNFIQNVRRWEHARFTG